MVEHENALLRERVQRLERAVDRFRALFENMEELRKRGDIALRESQKRQAFLLQLSDALRPLQDPESIQSAAVRILGTELGSSRTVYGDVECRHDGDYYVVWQQYCAPGVVTMTGCFRAQDFGSASLEKFRAGYTLVVDDIATCSGLTEAECLAFSALGIRAYVAVPLCKHGKNVAFITVHQAAPRSWKPLDVALVEETAQRTWDAVERARAEAELREAQARLKETDRRKDEFLAMLAHELRNPLAPIRTSLELMRVSADAPETVARVRKTMERQVGHMVRLIDDLLEISRITSGKIRLQRHPTSLAKIVSTAIEANRDAIDEARLALRVDLPDPGLILDVDPTRLVQVLSNLLHNSAKYTNHDGEIRIAARQTANGLGVTVSDSGIGMSRETLQNVFDLFTQANPQDRRSQKGLGIGLPLARRLIELHGGSIEAASDGPGRGSVFTIQLPPCIVAGAAAPEQAPKPEPELRRRIVVIDDNHDSAELMGELLRVLGCDSEIAYDGESGVALVHDFQPDIVLLDIGLPGIDGYETCRRIRHTIGSRVKVVAMTGYGQDRDKASAKSAGFDAHLTKPVDPSLLRRVLADAGAA